MKLIERQLCFERIKHELTVISIAKILLFKMRTRERSVIWTVLIVWIVLWLLVWLGVLPKPIYWLQLILLLGLAYQFFQQSERYRSSYYQALKIENEPWTTRKKLADLERLRDSLKSKNIYQREYVLAFIDQLNASLEDKFMPSIWQHPLFVGSLSLTVSFLTSLLVQNTGRLSNDSFFVILFGLITLLFVVVLIVPQIYDALTGKRRLLNYLLQCFIIISSDLDE